jgi:hypothetical protein
MGYVIAAYSVVLGTLVAYGLWVEAQRRALKRDAEERREAGPSR